MDIEELVKCLDLVHLVSEAKLTEILDAYHKEILYRKTGYILSFYKKEFNLSDSFFNYCLSKGAISNRGTLYGDNKYLTYISKWGLYAYPDLKILTNKGGSLDV